MLHYWVGEEGGPDPTSLWPLSDSIFVLYCNGYNHYYYFHYYYQNYFYQYYHYNYHYNYCYTFLSIRSKFLKMFGSYNSCVPLKILVLIRFWKLKWPCFKHSKLIFFAITNIITGKLTAHSTLPDLNIDKISFVLVQSLDEYKSSHFK